MNENACLTISGSDKALKGEITLNGSKSISNRALIIRALSGEDFQIKGLSNAMDTQTLEELLASKDDLLDAGPAGTTYRFMTAYLALQPGTQVLTGSKRMQQRPIGVLVDALRDLGADIEYVAHEGYPPLRIHTPKNLGQTDSLSVPANISSQFISALLMIAPYLPKGLKLEMEGRVVSKPYIMMTLRLMSYFGITYHWGDKNNVIEIAPQKYQAKDYRVEADWSAASYYYAITAFAEKADIQLNGLYEESVQGDAVIADLMRPLGVETEYNRHGIRLTRIGRLGNLFEHSFIDCPDIAQTIAVVCGGLGILSILRDLETLFIKETDRVTALQNELAKVGVRFQRLQEDLQFSSFDHAHATSGKAKPNKGPIPRIETYHDHRMAMAFAPLSMKVHKLIIEDPQVVEKSYPNFWKDLENLGFQIQYRADSPC
ncbi:MAG: 3-phosphoshikimate 1-carboxyvinyltransferase [Bacteroidota bacterium]